MLKGRLKGTLKSSSSFCKANQASGINQRGLKSARASVAGHHCPDGTPLLWPDPHSPPEEGDAVILVPFQDEKSNSCSTETEVREDRGLTGQSQGSTDSPNTPDM